LAVGSASNVAVDTATGVGQECGAARAKVTHMARSGRRRMTQPDASSSPDTATSPYTAPPPDIAPPPSPAPRRALNPAAWGGGLGLVVVAVGLIVIGIGWNGAAGAGGQINGVSDTRAQMPWLISGGLLGLALVVFGAALVIVHSARVDRSRLEAKLDELVDAVGRAGSDGAAPTNAAGLYVAGGTSYHRPDCRLVEGRTDVRYLTLAEAGAAELRPCRVCRPEAAETLGR
jgi:hypothetical protein